LSGEGFFLSILLGALLGARDREGRREHAGSAVYT
jgi:hypothetical protein